MRHIIRVELRRAFTGKSTKAALILGTLICIIHIFHNLGPAVNSIKYLDAFLKKGIIYPIQVFETWICGNTYNLEGFLYFMILPILAVLPYGDSYFTDSSSGFLVNIYARCKRRDYLLAKYIAVFTVAGTVFVSPLLLNLALCSALLPSLLPQVIANSNIDTAHIWFQLYAIHPYVYIFLYLLLDFIFAGLTACLALTASLYTEKRLVVLMAPFIIHIFIYSVCGMLSPKAMGYAPTYFLLAGSGAYSGWVFVFYGLAYFLIGGVWFLYKGQFQDTV